MINETDMLANKIKKKLDTTLAFLLNNSINQWDKLSLIKKDYMSIYSEFNNIAPKTFNIHENNKSRNINFSKFLDKKPIYLSDVVTSININKNNNSSTIGNDYSYANKLRPTSIVSLKNNYKKPLNFARVAYIRGESFYLSQNTAIKQKPDSLDSNLNSSVKNKLQSFITAMPSEGPKKKNIYEKINGGSLTVQKSPIKGNSIDYKYKRKSDKNDNFNLSNHKRQYQQTKIKSQSNEKLNLDTITSKNQYSKKIKLSEKFINVFKSNINTINTTCSNEYYNQNTLIKAVVNGINKEEDKKRKEEEKRIFEKIYAENLLNKKIQKDFKSNNANEIKAKSEIMEISQFINIDKTPNIIDVIKEEIVSEKSISVIRKKSALSDFNKNELELNSNNNELVQNNNSNYVFKFISDSKLVSTDIIPEINKTVEVLTSLIEEKELEVISTPCQENILTEDIIDNNIDDKSNLENFIHNKSETETKVQIMDPYETYLKDTSLSEILAQKFSISKLASNSLNFITKDSEDKLLEKQQPIEILTIMKLIYILIGENYDELIDNSIIKHLFTIIFPRLKVDSLKSFFQNSLNNNLKMTVSQITQFLSLLSDYPCICNTAELIRINRSMAYLSFIFKDIRDFISKKTDDGVFYIEELRHEVRTKLNKE